MSIEINKIYQGNALDVIKTFPDNFIDCCITSPPYWGLRDYGTAKWEGGDIGCDHIQRTNKQGNKTQPCFENTVFEYKNVCKKCGAIRTDNQIGLERTPEEYVEKLVEIFREVKRVLRDDGTLWLNLGDSYYNYRGETDYQVKQTISSNDAHIMNSASGKRNVKNNTLKRKDLVGIPWMTAFALRADGWYLRSDVIWCLSGGTYVYAKTQKGVMPVMIRDLIRLKPETIQLWNGKKWTRVLGMIKSERKGNEIELVLRSGERISGTPTHRFPTKRGLLCMSEIIKGDILTSVQLPETEKYLDCAIDKDAAWFAGLYIAEGSKGGTTIQIAGHSKEIERWDRLQKIAIKFGGHITRTVHGNCMYIRMYGKILHAILDELVSGRTAKDKCFAPVVWNYSNEFISEMLEGYLSGDGHWDDLNNRWRLGFMRNYNLERDIRTVCARLGYKLTLNLSSVKYKGKDNPTFHGEIRKERSGHFNEKDQSEIIKIQKARCREVYDIEVEDDPHLFSLASGILTHNSKRNPMPESVTDRPTKSHEYVFLLTKSPQYYYDYKAIFEPANYDSRKDTMFKGGIKYEGFNQQTMLSRGHERWPNKFNPDRRDGGTLTGNKSNKMAGSEYGGGGSGLHARNKRSVWDIPTRPFKGSHFAVFPEALIDPMIKAGCPKGGIVLDPFMGAGTTGLVAYNLNRNYIGIELNPKYVTMAEKRIKKVVSRGGLRLLS
jgi:DNA modification methylase